MICCGVALAGTPFVMVRYWCDKCKTEHLVDAVEMTEYVARLHSEQDKSNGKLPDIL